MIDGSGEGTGDGAGDGRIDGDDDGIGVGVRVGEKMQQPQVKFVSRNNDDPQKLDSKSPPSAEHNSFEV